METKSKSSEADDRQKRKKIRARSLARQHKEDGGQKHKSRQENMEYGGTKGEEAQPVYTQSSDSKLSLGVQSQGACPLIEQARDGERDVVLKSRRLFTPGISPPFFNATFMNRELARFDGRFFFNTPCNQKLALKSSPFSFSTSECQFYIHNT